MRRPLRLSLVAAAATCTLLAGCAEQPLPAPSPRPTSEVVPVVNGDQVDRILSRVVPAVAQADAAKDGEQLNAVADGPALTARTASYRLAAVDPALPAPAPIGGERVSVAVPREQEWPRTLLAVTRVGPEDGQPEVLLLTQASARDQYKLTAYTTMIPRATFPVLPALRDGVEVVAADDADGVVASAQDAVTAYARLLTEGAGSAEAERFAASPSTDAVIAAQDESREALTGPACPDCFSVTFTHTPNAENMWAFRTHDGGVFVLAQIDASTVMTSNGGAQITLHQELRALSGQSVLSTTGTFGYLEMVGLFIPPSGPRATISPIAFDRTPVSSSIG